MPITNPKSLDWAAVRAMDWPRQFATPLEVSVPLKTQALGQAVLTEMGVPTDGWFACLHVREASSWKEGESTRNSEIDTYAELIDRITAKGGWVIRMGDGSMSPLPIMHNVFDYALSHWKSPTLDLFLIASCRVYVGTHSGILDLAGLLDRPRLITNVPEPMWDLSYKPRDFTAHKSMVLVSTGEAVNPLHLMSRGLFDYGNLADVDVLPLSSQQLGSFADHFLKWMDDGFPEIPRDGRSLRFQREFMELVDRFADPHRDNDEVLLQKYRYASHLYAASPERVFDTWSGGANSS
jgi:putative glycosyltransferase (TIGR04372 family)